MTTTEKIDRLTEKVSFLESVTQAQSARIVALEKALKTRPLEVNVTADTESLTAYVHRLETLINDIEKELKESIAAALRVCVRGDDAMQDLVTRTANLIHAQVRALEQRVSDCELAVGTDKLEPAPQRDTSWHPYDVLLDDVDRPEENERVVVMNRAGFVSLPYRAEHRNWGENGDDTIVAWRYAKEGE